VLLSETVYTEVALERRTFALRGKASPPDARVLCATPDTGGRPMSNAVFGHAHSSVRLVRDG
jgi:hypothetical protein